MLQVLASTTLSRVVGPEELLIHQGQAEKHREIQDQTPAEVTRKMPQTFQLIIPREEPEERKSKSPL